MKLEPLELLVQLGPQVKLEPQEQLEQLVKLE